jgi:hypothetical protein
MLMVAAESQPRSIKIYLSTLGQGHLPLVSNPSSSFSCPSFYALTAYTTLLLKQNKLPALAKRLESFSRPGPR